MILAKLTHILVLSARRHAVRRALRNPEGTMDFSYLDDWTEDEEEDLEDSAKDTATSG